MACLQTDRYNLMGWKIDDAGQSRGAFEGEGDKMQGMV